MEADFLFLREIGFPSLLYSETKALVFCGQTLSFVALLETVCFLWSQARGIVRPRRPFPGRLSLSANGMDHASLMKTAHTYDTARWGNREEGTTCAERENTTDYERR